jgi:DNA polymerase-3 subunit alpha
MKWFPLCNFTHYSLQKGFSKPHELVAKSAKNSYAACGIADYKSISGAVSLYKECLEANIKPIIGCSFDGFTLFVKNKNGWLDLIQIVSSIDKNGDYDQEVMLQLARRKNWIAVGTDPTKCPVDGSDFYLKTDSFFDTYYVDKDQAQLHRILLCSGMKTTLSKIRKNPKLAKENAIFFESNDFYLRDKSEVAKILVEDPQMLAFDEIFEKCENFNILNKPMLPKFDTPGGIPEKDHLRDLARQGWTKLLAPKKFDDNLKKVYGERFNREFKVIEDAELFGYFLIVRDILCFAKDNGWMVGPGRGSAAGCLISYLIEITQIDPIEYDLLFERFYNAGRNTADHISLPDIDIDIPGAKRDDIIHYLKDKYGSEHVSQMCTFGRLQGRSAIKEVLRVNEACGFSEMNEITKFIPDEAAISDQLAEMDEEERSIIKWALINNHEELRDYCFINDDGQLDGEYAQFFEEAIRIEGTFKSQGKHAAGVVISAEPLCSVCPMVNQKNGDEKIAGLEMEDLESLGHVKFDVLALNLLDKLMLADQLGTPGRKPKNV